MNNICGTCGGYIGSFTYTGTGAKIYNCGNLVVRDNSCNHCYCIETIKDGSATGTDVPHKKCCNCGNQQVINNQGGTGF